MRVVTWNLFHGRSVPGAGRDLITEFGSALAGWEWDVALLQEVPPWWPPHLGAACGASARSARTSRNLGLPLRKCLAQKVPDLIKSNGGGANAILVRGQAITEHRSVVLRRRPERRVMHAVCLADGTWWGNLHAQVHSDAHAFADLERGGAALRAWAGSAPTIYGGDTNVRPPHAAGFTVLGGHDVDYVMARGWQRVGPVERLGRGALSDHAPVAMGLRPVP